MIREEIKIVKRRLEDYRSYRVLALESARKALETQELIRESGQPRSMGWNKVAPTESHIELSSLLNALISDQTEYERDAARYYERMKAIEHYIEANYKGEIRTLMKCHYLEGKTYDELEKEVCVCSAGLKLAVTRAMEDTDFAAAEALL